MKITKSQLKQIIKEELESVLIEREDGFMPLGHVVYYTGTPPREAVYVFQRECEYNEDTYEEAPTGEGRWHTLSGASGKADFNELVEIAKQVLKDPKRFRGMPVKVPSDPSITGIAVRSYEFVSKKGYPPRC